jgi:hypothetical protein
MSHTMKAVCTLCNRHYGEQHAACGHPMCECSCTDPAPGEPVTRTVVFMEADI